MKIREIMNIIVVRCAWFQIGYSTKCLEKLEKKTLFTHTFCRTSLLKLNLRNLYKVSRKTWKNTVFSHFQRERCAKSSKNAVFSHFLRTLNKVSRKNVWRHCFLTLLADRRAKSSKNAIFAFLVNFSQSVSKDVKKHFFLTLFAERRA